MESKLQKKIEERFEWMNVFVECGDGWHRLIYKMCEEIEQLYKNKNVAINADLDIYQIKSKFAGLRVYYSSTFNKELDVVIDKYAKLSTETCELCGQPGGLINKNGYMIILCEDCDKKRGL